MTDESESDQFTSGWEEEEDTSPDDAGESAGTTAAEESGGFHTGSGLDDVADQYDPHAVEDPAEIDPSELTTAERSLHPRIRIVWIVRSIVSAAFAGGLAFLADTFVLEVGILLPVGVALFFGTVGAVHALLRYRVWRYEVREDALYLERGVVTRVRTVVPFVRIQHVDTSRGPIERAIGLSTSVVYTAGSRGADVAIPGLEAERADDLQHRLKRLAIASEADTAV